MSIEKLLSEAKNEAEEEQILSYQDKFEQYKENQRKKKEAEVEKYAKIFGKTQPDKTFEKLEDVAKLADEYIKKNKITTKDFAESVGISRPAMSQYLNGKYPSDPAEIEKKVVEHLKKMGFITDTVAVKKKPVIPEFIGTDDAIGILGVCQSCQEHNALGIIVGESGLGKTHTLRQYTKQSRVCHIESDDSMTIRDLLSAIEKSLGLKHIGITTWNRIENIRIFFQNNCGHLLIIDEADKLISKNSQKKIEILRAIFDQSPVGLIFAGEPILEGRIKGLIPRMANRVDFYYNLQGLTKKDVQRYLVDFKYTPEAFEEIYRRAANNKNGCFRLLNRTMRNVLRVIGDTSEEITLDVINEASAMMML